MAASPAWGPSRRQVPAGARSLELAGHTVFPGLVGMHNHTFYTTRGRSVQLQFSAPRLYLGTGITTAPHDRGHLALSRDQHEEAASTAARFPDRGCTSPAPILRARAAPRPWRRSDRRRGPAHRELLGGRRRHVVQGLHRHQPRSARRGNRGGARARTKVHGPPLFGVVPRGRRPGDRQPRARPLHQQRLRAEPHAGPLRGDLRTAC